MKKKRPDPIAMPDTILMKWSSSLAIGVSPEEAV
jgi:hypothetical protein